MSHQDYSHESDRAWGAMAVEAGKVDLDRLAVLIAEGSAPIPGELPPDEQIQLLKRVAQLRRERLVRYIARAIALDISRSRESYGSANNVETQV